MAEEVSDVVKGSQRCGTVQDIVAEECKEDMRHDIEECFGLVKRKRHHDEDRMNPHRQSG